MPNQRSRMVLNKLVLLEKHLRNLQTKIVLCRHDAKGISHDKGRYNGRYYGLFNTHIVCMLLSSFSGADYSFNRIGDRFGSMEQDISHLLAQWDENKNVLLHIINSKRASTSAPLPSPPSSPATSIDSICASSLRSYTTTTAEPIVTVSSEPPPSQQQSSAWPLQQRVSPHSPPPHSSHVPPLYPPKTTNDVHLSDHQLLSVATTNPSLSSRQSWITAAAVASFLESRRVYRLQTQHKQKV